MQSSDIMAGVGMVAACLNFGLSLRMTIAALRMKTWARRLMLNHLRDYHGVKFSEEPEEETI